MDEQPILADIKRLIDSGRCVAFLGAGLSDRVYPSWECLVHRLCDGCAVPFTLEEEIKNGKDRVQCLLELADRALDANTAEYRNVLYREFGRTPTRVKRVYDLLARLPFMSYVTTNFDPLLALALDSHRTEFPYYGIYAYPDLPVTMVIRRCAFYIHGRIVENEALNVDHIVLGKRAFDHAYGGGRGTLKSFLEQLLLYTPVVFLGFSLRERSFQDSLRRCKDIRDEIAQAQQGAALPELYALFAKEKIYVLSEVKVSEVNALPRDGGADEARTLMEMGIQAAFYEAGDDEHSGLDRVLELWCQAGPIPTRRGIHMAGSL